MRDDRFDSLAKVLATGGTRRRFFAFVAGGVVARPLMRPASPAPTCQAGDAPCAEDDACCSGVCTMHGRCGCFDSGHLCPNDGHCCSGACLNNRCR